MGKLGEPELRVGRGSIGGIERSSVADNRVAPPGGVCSRDSGSRIRRGSPTFPGSIPHPSRNEPSDAKRIRALDPRRARRLTMLLLASALVACPSGPQSGPERVIARVGEAPLARTRPPLPARPLRLGDFARRAVRVPPGVGFSVALEEDATRLEFSLGIPREPDPSGGEPPPRGTGPPDPVTFEVMARRGEEWTPIFSEPLTDDATGWHDYSLPLADVAPGARDFRFTSTAPPGSRIARIAWGAIRFSAPDPASARPNVILISLDTLSAGYLGLLGNPAPISPNLDALLSRSFVFRRAFAQYGNTVVSHSSLFSGLYPIHHGRYTRASSDWSALSSLVGRLAAAGYRTRAFTEDVYVGSAYGFSVGFDAYDDGPTHGGEAMYGNAERTFGRALTWLETSGGRGPFFLFLHTYQVHEPYLVPDDGARALANSLTPGDTREFPRHETSLMVRRSNQGDRPITQRDAARLKALHFGEIQHLDRVLGRFFARLEASGLQERTLVVLTSDHGDQFGELGAMGHGSSLHDAVLHVPLAFFWPGRVEPGSSEAVVQLVDVMPTILERAEVPVPDGLDGRSLAALLDGRAAELEPRPAFAEMRGPPPGCRGGPCAVPRYSVRDGALKLVRSADGSTRRLVRPEDDPGEERDLSRDRPDDLARLGAQLDVYLVSTPKPSRRPDATPEGIDEEDLHERLRALGYAD